MILIKGLFGPDSGLVLPPPPNLSSKKASSEDGIQFPQTLSSKLAFFEDAVHISGPFCVRDPPVLGWSRLPLQ